MGNLRWSSDRNIKFINEYRQHECLWDPKHSKYKHRYAREEAYKAIQHAMELESVVEVISKIRTLRNTHNNEILKAKKSMMMANKVYVSKIPWLPHLDFIKSIDKDVTENNTTPDIYPHTSLAAPEFENVSTQNYPGRSNDEFDLFGRIIAEQLRQLPLDIALETEEMLLSTLRKQRIKYSNPEESTMPTNPIGIFKKECEEDDWET